VKDYLHHLGAALQDLIRKLALTSQLHETLDGITEFNLLQQVKAGRKSTNVM